MDHLVERYIRFIKHEARKQRCIELRDVRRDQIERFVKLNLPLDPEKVAYGVAWCVRKEKLQPLHPRDVESSAQLYLPAAQEFCDRTKSVMAEAALIGWAAEPPTHTWQGATDGKKLAAHAIKNNRRGPRVSGTECGKTVWNLRSPDGLQKCQKCLELVGPRYRGLP